MDDLRPEVEVLEVGEDHEEGPDQGPARAGLHLLEDELEAPGQVPDEVEAEGEERAQDGRREGGEEDGHRRDEHQLEEDVGDGHEEAGLDLERVGVDDGQEDRGHGRRHDEERQDEAEELAQDELGPVQGLGQQGEDRLLVDLLVHEPRADEDGHQDAEDRDRGQADVLDDLDPVADRQDGQDPAGDDADGGEEEEQVEDAVALGFLEGDPGDGPDLHVRVTVSTKMSSRVSVRGLREMSRPFWSWMRPTTSSTRASS